jgi:hypothetical protein
MGRQRLQVAITLLSLGFHILHKLTETCIESLKFCEIEGKLLRLILTPEPPPHHYAISAQKGWMIRGNREHQLVGGMLGQVHLCPLISAPYHRMFAVDLIEAQRRL